MPWRNQLWVTVTPGTAGQGWEETSAAAAARPGASKLSGTTLRIGSAQGDTCGECTLRQPPTWGGAAQLLHAALALLRINGWQRRQGGVWVGVGWVRGGGHLLLVHAVKYALFVWPCRLCSACLGTPSACSASLHVQPEVALAAACAAGCGCLRVELAGEVCTLACGER